jgi:hypothetical protein
MNAAEEALDKCREPEIVEMALLLPGWQASALETVARSQGLTAGQMLRRLIGEYFAKFAQPRAV